MNKKLDIAIKCSIQDNLNDYIQFGEFDPSLSALECVAHKINTYSDSDSVYEAIDGDSVLGMNLFAMVMEPEYFDETATRLRLRKVIMSQASRVLLDYEAFAWGVWEQRQPAEPDINVPMPETA
tara:strand:- start:65 stop:436 length:372 start_codon:yes stop_codon:yes gene_type:complete